MVGADWALVSAPEPAPHGPHALAAPPGADFAAVTDHPHIQDGSTPSGPDSLAHAVVPRFSGTLAAVGLFVAMTTVLIRWQHRPTAHLRGPPRSPTVALTGQQLLTRLCIARR
jgi:hypothetical protein